jgi:hypothetical protein
MVIFDTLTLLINYFNQLQLMFLLLKTLKSWQKFSKKALYFMVMCLEIFFWIQMMQFAWPNQIKYNCGSKRENCLREENYSSEETI